ncbi:MAG: hypothetical protein HQK60_09505 [Deltaproteobacteria bacterium]|nr:hypothetical protein [Deltaproteobacteria bacterium]
MSEMRKMLWITWLITLVFLCLAGPALADPVNLDQVKMDSSCPKGKTGPTIAIMVGSASKGRALDLDEAQVCRSLEEMLHDRFIRLGFRPVDPKRVQQMVEAKKLRLILSGDITAAISAGSSLGAQLLLTVASDFRSKEITVIRSASKTVYLTVNLRLLNAGNGAYLANTSVSERFAGLDPAYSVLAYLEKNVDGLAAELYQKYCENAPKNIGTAKRKSGKKKSTGSSDDRGERLRSGEEGASQPTTKGSHESTPKATSMDNL